MQNMKLTAELVPETVWFKSLAKLLPRKIWDSIRQNHMNQYGKRCQICEETEGIMNLHEIWNYDDINHVQKLDGFILLCAMCHHIKHIGLAGILANEGKLDYEKLIKHFCVVNECSVEDFRIHVNETFAIWRERSKHQWKQDFGEYGQYIKQSEK
jgi:hypothetical protein